MSLARRHIVCIYLTALFAANASSFVTGASIQLSVSLAKLGRKKLNCTENLTILVEFIIKNKNRPISARLGVNFDNNFIWYLDQCQSSYMTQSISSDRKLFLSVH